MPTYISAALVSGGFVGLSLIVVHMAAWPLQRYWVGWWRWVPYALGVAAILLGGAGWAAVQGRPLGGWEAWLAWLIISAGAGLGTVGAYAGHAALDAWQAQRVAAALERGGE